LQAACYQLKERKKERKKESPIRDSHYETILTAATK
jgi:hypothetical protein